MCACVCVCMRACMRIFVYDDRRTSSDTHRAHARSDVGGGISGVYNQYFNVRVKKRIIIKEKQTNNRNTIEPSPRFTASPATAIITLHLGTCIAALLQPPRPPPTLNRVSGSIYLYIPIYIHTTVAIPLPLLSIILLLSDCVHAAVYDEPVAITFVSVSKTMVCTSEP